MQKGHETERLRSQQTAHELEKAQDQLERLELAASKAGVTEKELARALEKLERMELSAKAEGSVAQKWSTLAQNVGEESKETNTAGAADAIGNDKEALQAELTAQKLRLREQEAKIEELNAMRGVMEQMQHEQTHKQQVLAHDKEALEFELSDKIRRCREQEDQNDELSGKLRAVDYELEQMAKQHKTAKCAMATRCKEAADDAAQNDELITIMEKTIADLQAKVDSAAATDSTADAAVASVSKVTDGATASWFQGQPTASASDSQIASWFRGQPAALAQNETKIAAMEKTIAELQTQVKDSAAMTHLCEDLKTDAAHNEAKMAVYQETIADLSPSFECLTDYLID